MALDFPNIMALGPPILSIIFRDRKWPMAMKKASGKTQAEADEKFDKLVTAVSALMDELTK